MDPNTKKILFVGGGIAAIAAVVLIAKSSKAAPAAAPPVVPPQKLPGTPVLPASPAPPAYVPPVVQPDVIHNTPKPTEPTPAAPVATTDTPFGPVACESGSVLNAYRSVLDGARASSNMQDLNYARNVSQSLGCDDLTQAIDNRMLAFTIETPMGRIVCSNNETYDDQDHVLDRIHDSQDADALQQIIDIAQSHNCPALTDAATQRLQSLAFDTPFGPVVCSAGLVASAYRGVLDQVSRATDQTQLQDTLNVAQANGCSELATYAKQRMQASLINTPFGQVGCTNGYVADAYRNVLDQVMNSQNQDAIQQTRDAAAANGCSELAQMAEQRLQDLQNNA